MIKLFKKIFSKKIGPIAPQVPIKNPDDFDPKWVWDVYGTGIRPPKRPIWLDKFEMETCYSTESKIIIDPERYDELEAYLKGLEAHRGKVTKGPRKIAIWSAYGSQIEIEKSKEG